MLDFLTAAADSTDSSLPSMIKLLGSFVGVSSVLLNFSILNSIFYATCCLYFTSTVNIEGKDLYLSITSTSFYFKDSIDPSSSIDLSIFSSFVKTIEEPSFYCYFLFLNNASAELNESVKSSTFFFISMRRGRTLSTSSLLIGASLTN